MSTTDPPPTGLPVAADGPVDLLVVGGGPAGTAAAFRARELGLSVLVVDFDDLMKRIRDYSKDKLILPSFGGGDRVAFPKGGDAIAALRFDPIDKDDMCRRWKALYADHGVSYAVGVELLGIDGEATDARNEAGFSVRLFDHREHAETGVQARAVALALGRGVPRRFDIPGNTEGIALRLENAGEYVGRPACVVGGGTSAAEAVIAISNAKAAADDPTAVYWSYRGDRMPRVSQALADVFFAAYVGNGNIRYFPRSEPAAVVTGDDHQEYLSLRVDRRELVGRPNETTHLEFPKQCCIACIGEDLPEALLGSLGISRVEGGPKGRRRMVASPILESCRRNVFVLGDLLSQAYFECDDFAADPAGFREVRHRGNIKTALRDGVLVAEAVAQRLQGVDQPRVTVEDAEQIAAEDGLAVATAETIHGAEEEPAATAGATSDRGEGQGATGATVLRVTPGGETEELRTFRPGTTVRIGSDSSADLGFDDGLVAEHHADLEIEPDGTVVLRDAGSASGTYLRLRPGLRTVLEEGDLLQVGRQFLQLGAQQQLVHYDARGQVVGRYPIDDHWSVLGRDAPDVVLDAGDRSLSRRHLALAVVEGEVEVKDLRSANGTFLRLRRGARLEHGSRFRIGQQQLALQIGEALVDLALHQPARPGTLSGVRPAAAAPRAAATAPASSLSTPQPTAPEASPAAGDGPSVTFRPDGRTLPIAEGQSICDLAEQHGIRLKAECHAGICGSDPIRILEGAEHLVALGDQEAETLEDVCELEPGPCRLACMARVTGPVVVEVVE